MLELLNRNLCLMPIRLGDELRRKSCGNLSWEVPGDSFGLAKNYSTSDLRRRSSASHSNRQYYSGVLKRRGPLNRQRPRSQCGNEGYARSQASPLSRSSADRMLSSSCEQVSSNDSCVRLDSDANIETKGKSHVSGDGELRTAGHLPSGQQAESGLESSGSGSLDYACLLALLSPLHPKNEFQANLVAASDETRPLFLQYYERTYGGYIVEDEDTASNYWKWDQDRQQWFHRDEDTQSVMWFSSELTQPCSG
ncbi:hypothetical protein F5Y19DRAFT_141912 [Xylariaceae sp. FL1651]|nr:hypothetical protein F5Y19DRAFT_141912 [Xylariaceae sp. FL1651]